MAQFLGRDLTNASAALDRADAAGVGDDGAADVENALWRVDAAFEKLHDVIALGFGVPTLKLTNNRKGSSGLSPIAAQTGASEGPRGEAVARTLLDIDEQIGDHRFLELRHQLTHSLAPILAWQSLLWFEVADVDEKGGVLAYSARHLTPSFRIQGDTPPHRLYSRTIADGRDVIDLMRRAMLALAELLTAVGKLEPPPVLWRVTQTGEVFVDRVEASRAARAASG